MCVDDGHEPALCPSRTICASPTSRGRTSSAERTNWGSKKHFYAFSKSHAADASPGARAPTRSIGPRGPVVVVLPRGVWGPAGLQGGTVASGTSDQKTDFAPRPGVGLGPVGLGRERLGPRPSLWLVRSISVFVLRAPCRSLGRSLVDTIVRSSNTCRPRVVLTGRARALGPGASEPRPA